MNKQLLQIFILSFIFLTGVTNVNCQWEKIKGKWVDSAQHYIQILDTVRNGNTISINSYDENFYFKLQNDTLVFYWSYTSSRDNYSQQHIDNYYFKMLSVTDRFLTIRPISEKSIKLFGSNSPIHLTRKEFFIDTTLRVEKIIFHVGPTGWNTSTTSIQIDSTREIIYNRTTGFGFFRPGADTAAGDRTGTISEDSYRELLTLLRTSNIRHLKYEEHYCCDASVVTLIIYASGERIYIKSMFLPKIMDDLIYLLSRIPNRQKLKMASTKFSFEQ